VGSVKLDWKHQNSNRCACEFCDGMTTNGDVLCTFCVEHCPATPELHGQTEPFERSMADVIFGLMRYKVHDLKNELEELGADLAFWVPLLLDQERTRNSVRSILDAVALDEQFQSLAKDIRDEQRESQTAKAR